MRAVFTFVFVFSDQSIGSNGKSQSSGRSSFCCSDSGDDNCSCGNLTEKAFLRPRYVNVA